jgi:hypothetical protein
MTWAHLAYEILLLLLEAEIEKATRNAASEPDCT